MGGKWDKMEEQFNCQKCKIEIGGHNQYLHDGMCDDCFFNEYFPEDAQIFETEIEPIKRLCHSNRKENLSFLRFLHSTEIDNERFEKIIKEVISKILCQNKTCCEFLQQISTENIDKLINNAPECLIVFNILENAKREFEEDIFVFENPDI